MTWHDGASAPGPDGPARRATAVLRHRPRLGWLCAGGWMVGTALAAMSGCVLTPAGTKEEKVRLADVGRHYEARFEERALPELPAEPTWRDVLRRALLANGEVEAAYFDWKAAVEEIDIAGAYPNSDVSLGYSYMFSSERVKAFDRMTFSAGFDNMENLSFPTKTAQAARVALDTARVAGERFRVAKFEVQRKVLTTWADYALQARTIRLRQEDLTLRRMLAQAGAVRVQAGERQPELLGAQIAVQTAESELRDLEAEHESTRATLNSLMARDARAPLAAPVAPTPPRPVPAADGALLAAAAEVFPEVASFARQVQGRRDALELARMRWIPDINPAFSITGSISQAVGAVIVLPTKIGAIRGSIRQAEAELRASEAVLRQKRADRIGEYVALLVMLRNNQRRVDLFQGVILPGARWLSESQTRAYEGGGATFSDVVESRRTLLDTELVIAQSQAAIEKALVEIECCLGIDIETLESPPARDSVPAKPDPSGAPAAAPGGTTNPTNPEVHHYD